MKIGQTRGALIGDVDPNGPAAQSGLLPGDVIVEANGKAVEDSRALRLLVSGMAPGSQLNLRVQRKGQTRNVTLTLSDLPQKESAVTPSSLREKPQPVEPDAERIGIAITEVTPDLAVHLELPANVKGLVIADVEEGSLAEEAGLQPGDLIVEVNDRPVATVGEFQSVMEKRSNPVLLLIKRAGQTRYVAVER
jgi:serine protease Do